MSKKDIHVVPDGPGQWKGVREGGQRASFVVDTKKEAMDRARALAKKDGVELVPHLKDGTISNPNTYGPHDPNPPKDKHH